MKVGILAGGLGTRLSEETVGKPKPMVEIGGNPILWHIMKGYAAAGFGEFVLALGYKAEVIKEYFINYRFFGRGVTVGLGSGEITMHEGAGDDWTVHMLDTGLHTQTGGRIRKVAQFAGKETFMLTYGDGVSDIDLKALLKFHRKQGRLATVTAVRPPARFGSIVLKGDKVARFEEKPQVGEGWINGGFFVLEPGVAKYIKGDESVWEREPMERLAKAGQLSAFRHEGFWHCMDTLRDLRYLDGLWESGKAPWKTWR